MNTLHTYIRVIILYRGHEGGLRKNRERKKCVQKFHISSLTRIVYVCALDIHILFTPN